MPELASLRGRARLRAATVLSAFALLAALAALASASSQQAQATSATYCVDVYLAGFDHCDAPDRHSLTANEAFNYYGSSTTVCAGATLNGSFYGSYACGNSGFAEHCYDGSNLLVGRIHNGQSGAQHMEGQYFYSEACP